jgi:hypothetical protein
MTLGEVMGTKLDFLRGAAIGSSPLGNRSRLLFCLGMEYLVETMQSLKAKIDG